ncbi:MAG: hypothetical protein FWH03_00190 [Firmicutes bacterium]|nr:hypothetical protein [Bacillota bacterium]
MAKNQINQSIDNSKSYSTKHVEQEIKTTNNNITIDLSKMDMQGAIDSFQKLEAIAKASNFDLFVQKILDMQAVFNNFQKTVQTTNTSVTNFSKSADKFSGNQTAVIIDTEINTGDISAEVVDITANISASFEGAASAAGSAAKDIGSGFKDIGSGMKDVGSGFKDIGCGFKDIGGGVMDIAKGLNGAVDALNGLATALPAAAKGFMEMCVALDGVFMYIPHIAVFGAALYGLSLIGEDLVPAGEAIQAVGEGMKSIADAMSVFGEGLQSIVTAIAMLIPLLPALGTAMLEMAINMSGILAYLPELLIFIGILIVLGLLGEGIKAAGEGLVNVALGLTALIEIMPAFIECLALIGENIWGILLFILLGVAMFLMAMGLEKINEQMGPFVENMQKLQEIMSIGFVIAFGVFALILIAMSFFLEKIATGLDKITNAMKNQCKQLAILNPLLAAKAILSNLIMGGITVAAAIAGALLVKTLIPAMATGGVVDSPTMAMVGEGRYPEAVVPLGESPQFAEMKADIANAVLAGMGALNQSGGGGGGKDLTVQLHIDGRQLAETTVRDFVDALNNEGYGVLRADAVYR